MGSAPCICLATLFRPPTMPESTLQCKNQLGHLLCMQQRDQQCNAARLTLLPGKLLPSHAAGACWA